MVVNEIIASEGGTDSTRSSGEALTATSVALDAVDFAGTVDLQHAVSGSRGSTTTHDRIDGPIQVVDSDGVWRVARFTFDGQPLIFYPEGVEAVVAPVHLLVGFVLSNAATTSVLVTLRSDSPGTVVNIEAAQLIMSSGATEPGHASFGHALPTGVLSFPRTGDAPARLDVTARLGSGSTVTFAVVLHSQPA